MTRRKPKRRARHADAPARPIDRRGDWFDRVAVTKAKEQHHAKE